MRFRNTYRALSCWLSAATLLACWADPPVAASPPRSVTYLETTDAKRVAFTWNLSMTDDDRILLEVIRPEERFLNRFEPSGETLQWRHLTPGREIEARREGNAIRLRGTLDGQEIEKAWTLDGAPWYQALSFCLRPFLQSELTEVEFWMIRPDTVNAVKLRAQKMEKETITLNGRQFEAWHLTVRRTGFLSAFWHGDYWYRLEDGLFLKYRGVHGPPGTPETVVEADL